MSRSLAGLLVGKTLADRYEIEEMIGRGGMSLVYRARDRRLHRPVAVKIISLPDASDHEHLRLRERLRREAAAAARVPPHPNVVQVYDYGTDAALDLDFIAMELLEGRDLKALLRDGPPSYEEAVRIILETARGLSAGHRAGIVHRDVKPANIIVTSDAFRSCVKLLDFGIAKALETAMEEDLTRAGQVPHSPAYASPEQRSPETGGSATPASDVYQLGLVGYELLSGERAQEGRRAEGERWQAVPGRVRAVLDQALQPLPRDRFADAAQFAEALSAAVATDPHPVALPAPPIAGREPPASDGATAFLEVAQPGIVPVPGTGGAAPAAETGGRGLARWLLAGAGILLLVLALRSFWGGGEPERGAGAFASDIEALDDEFRELTEEAHENLRERPEELIP